MINSTVLTIARYGFLEAVRGRLLWVFIGLTLFSILLALFVGETALTESRETQVAMMSGFMRLAAVATIMFFVVASVARDFQDKSVELLFSVNMPRYQVFLGKLLGMSLLVLVVTLLYIPALLGFADFSSILFWAFSLWCELSIVALISLVFILSLESIALSLAASFALYILARLMPLIQSMGESRIQADIVNSAINLILDLIDLVLPRLGEFTHSSWLMYNDFSVADLVVVITETVLCVLLFTIVGILDINRKSI